MYVAVRKLSPKVVLIEISDDQTNLIGDVVGVINRRIEVPLLEWHPTNMVESSVGGDENEMVHGDDTRVDGDDYFGPDVTILDDSVDGGDENVVEGGENVGNVGDDSIVVEDGCDNNGGEGGDKTVGDEYRADWYDDDDFDTSA
ncbi:hypothetical protein LIER_06297 [Lithospermum erythrorhizon]|uniref:Uncharacterized protein n=1 Tax=Lithospermum erythrorhizon TaxID=34254 RepID=A0AAV3P8I5_LITER